jgi:hypothetical protein
LDLVTDNYPFHHASSLALVTNLYIYFRNNKYKKMNSNVGGNVILPAENKTPGAMGSSNVEYNGMTPNVRAMMEAFKQAPAQEGGRRRRRGSKKATRKSKKTARKSKKTARKSKKTARKSKKTARKSKKTARKSKKTARK